MNPLKNRLITGATFNPNLCPRKFQVRTGRPYPTVKIDSNSIYKNNIHIHKK